MNRLDRTRQALRRLLDDLLTPSGPDESLHAWGAIAVTHAVLAAAAANLLTLAGVEVTTGVSVTLICLYLVLKEIGIDLRRHGSFGDSLVDTGFVGVGAFAMTLPMFPLTLILMTLAGVLLKALVDPPKES